MDMLEHRFNIKTWEPLDSLPRITEFYHSIVYNSNYYSSGQTRQGHNHCIFHYTLRGEGETFCGNNVYKITPGTGFLNVINEIDAGYRYPVDGKDEWEFIVICFDRGNTRDIVNEMINTYGRTYEIPLDDEFIRGIINEYYFSPERTLSKHESYSLFTKLINKLIDSKTSETQHIEKEFITKVEGLVSEGIDKYITVNEIADIMGISHEHLSRSFRKYTGRSLKAYIVSQQLAQICGLLLNTDMSVDEIAAGMSFSSGSNLVQFFKRYTGMTTSEYKKLRIEPFL